MCGRPPRVQGFYAAVTGLVDCGHVSGLCVRSGRPLAQMGCADRVPKHFGDVAHHRVPRSIPILGSTDRHLAAFLASARRVAMVSGLGRLWPAVDLAARHHGPQDAGHLVGQRHGPAASFLGRRASRLTSHGEPRPGLANWITAVAPRKDRKSVV